MCRSITSNAARLVLALLVSLAASVGIASRAAAVEPICPGGSSPDPNVIFCDDFEYSAGPDFKATATDFNNHHWGGVPQRWFDYPGGDYARTSAYCNHSLFSTAAYAGLCGLVFDYAPNGQGTPYMGPAFNSLGQADVGGGSGVGVPIYARWYVKVSPGFVWHSNSSKMFYFFAREGGGGGNIIYRSPVFVSSGGAPFFKLYPDYTCNTTQTSSWVQNQGTPVALTGANQNRWFGIEVMVRNSGVDQANGEIKMWIDGVLKLHHTGVQTRGSCRSGATTGYNHIWVNAYLGGAELITHDWQQIYYDNLVISRAPIGPLNVVRPMPPTSLSVR